MLTGEALVVPVDAVAAAKGYLRVSTTGEDALIGGLVRSAAEVCERFLGQALLVRGFVETVAVTGAWTRLGAAPVRTIAGVTGLAAADYAVDIDAAGTGFVRVTGGGLKVATVTYDAGLAVSWGELPEAVRQGIVRLAAHLYAERDREGGAGPPAAVTALWRPFRRVRL